MFSVYVVVAAAIMAVVDAKKPKKPSSPHIVMLLIDDLGWGNVGWHRRDLPEEVKTPEMDSLVAHGIELKRFYAFKYCSPTRSALQTGRNPIHVNVANGRTDLHNPKDPISGYFGIPRNMTAIAAKLATAGYATHAVGKWDAGIATFEHTPVGRGYLTWTGYFGHCNDYWNQVDKCGMSCGSDKQMIDLWTQNRTESHPAKTRINPRSCSQKNQHAGCRFEDDKFKDVALRVINEHPLDGTPLFLFWATHGIHGPREVPHATYNKFANISDPRRRMYAALVSYVDGLIHEVVSAMKNRNMWEDTLIFMSSDNGGDGEANNWPLRGAKFSNWEGGIHVPAFVSGGALRENQRGTKLEGLAAVWDFYATFCDIAGVDPEDKAAAEAGLPAVDSISQWSYWRGKTHVAPRTELAIGGVLGASAGVVKPGADQTTVEGLIQGRWKLLVGSFSEAIWTGPKYPNKTSSKEEWEVSAHCYSGCLFDLVADPSEHDDLSALNPKIVKHMLKRIHEINRTVFSPHRGVPDPLGCKTALKEYGGVWGPFLDIKHDAIPNQLTVV